MIMDPLKAIVTGRGAGCWKCPECNAKCTQLNRLFGSWPPRPFAKQSAEMQARFFQDLRGKPGGVSLETYVVETMTRLRIESEGCQVGGEYLPPFSLGD